MSFTRNRHTSYDCRRLKGIAHLTYEEMFLKSNEMTTPELRTSSLKDCANKMECGIAVRTGITITYRWQMCPAHPDFDPSTLP